MWLTSEFDEKKMWDDIREALREEVIEEILEEKIKLKDEKLAELRIIDAEIVKLKDMLAKEKDKKAKKAKEHIV